MSAELLAGANQIGLSSALSLADSIGSSIMSNSANAKSKRAVWVQYMMQNMLMDKQNEYNKPINQMARLREAGLNPNLVYGDGGATMASASAGNPSVADVTPSSGTLNILGKMQALQQIKQSEANVAETEARTDAIDDNIALKKEELRLRSRALDIQEKSVGAMLGLRGAQTEKVLQEKEYMEDKSPVSVTSDPIGYFVNALPNLYDTVHDSVLSGLESMFGKRNVYYAKKRK